MSSPLEKGEEHLDAAPGPLTGVLVVALEQAVAAPLASCRLVDAGARVIKIERTSGDFARHYDTVASGQSAYFAWLNRGKESLVLDIKDAEDRELLERMLLRADVFLVNLAPGAAERAGLAPDRLRGRTPRLITCAITGYGSRGPYSQMRAYDLLVQAESALASITGTPDGPGRVGASVCDIGAGLAAYSRILEALIERDRTGRGRHIEISLFDSMAEWMTVPLFHEEGGDGWPRIGLAHPTIAPYGVFPLAADDQVLIGVQNDAEFERLCAVLLDRPELASDPRFERNPGRVANREELDAILARATRQLTRDEVAAALDEARIAYGFVNTVADLSRHPQLRRMTLDSPTGEVSMPVPAGRAEAAAKPGPLPDIGEHSASLRREFAAEDSCPNS